MPYCQHCGEHFEEMKNKTKHVRSCLENPRTIKKLADVKFKSKDEVALRGIRDRVRSYEDIFKEVDMFLDERGYYIRWDSRPDTFNTTIKTEHYHQPDINRNKEMIYVGWTGRFEGQIYNKDGTTADISFWDLNGEMNGIYNLSFLRSSSGSWTSSFTGSGTIFVEDFPNLFNRYTKIGFDDRYNVRVQEQIEKIMSKISTEEARVLNEDEALKGLARCSESIRTLEHDIRKVRELYTKDTKEKFWAAVDINLPALEIPFVDMSKYNTFIDTYNRQVKGESYTIDISKFKEALLRIEEDAKSYIDRYAEHFV